MTGTSNAHLLRQADEPVFTLLKKLRSAVRTGRKLCLSPDEWPVLLRFDIYDALCRTEANEMRKACALDADNDNTNWAASGCGSGPTQEPGASAGSSVAVTGVLSRGARQRLSEAMLEVRHRRKP